MLNGLKIVIWFSSTFSLVLGHCQFHINNDQVCVERDNAFHIEIPCDHDLRKAPYSKDALILHKSTGQKAIVQFDKGLKECKNIYKFNLKPLIPGFIEISDAVFENASGEKYIVTGRKLKATKCN